MRKKVLLIANICLLITGCASEKDGTVSTSTGTFPVYGNWCGPDHPRAGTSPPPIDDVDAACKTHDLCYAEKGYFDCDCDSSLMITLSKVKTKRQNGKKQMSLGEYLDSEDLVTKQMRSYFSTTACVPHNPLSIIGSVPVKAATAMEMGTDAVGIGGGVAIGSAYSLIISPFYLLAKGLCALHDAPSCANTK